MLEKYEIAAIAKPSTANRTVFTTCGNPKNGRTMTDAPRSTMREIRTRIELNLEYLDERDNALGIHHTTGNSVLHNYACGATITTNSPRTLPGFLVKNACASAAVPEKNS